MDQLAESSLTQMVSETDKIILRKGTQVKVDDPRVQKLQECYGKLTLDGVPAPAIIVGALCDDLQIAVLAGDVVFPKNVFWIDAKKVRICGGVLRYRYGC